MLSGRRIKASISCNEDCRNQSRIEWASGTLQVDHVHRATCRKHAEAAPVLLEQYQGTKSGDDYEDNVYSRTCRGVEKAKMIHLSGYAKCNKSPGSAQFPAGHVLHIF